jgi:hypothetical protein
VHSKDRREKVRHFRKLAQLVKRVEKERESKAYSVNEEAV